MSKESILNKMLTMSCNRYKLSFFQSRYGDGIVAVITLADDLFEVVEDGFNGGDSDWERVRFGLSDIPWYPIAFGNTIEEAMYALNIRLLNVFNGRNLGMWEDCVCKVEEYLRKRESLSKYENISLVDFNTKYFNGE